MYLQRTSRLAHTLRPLTTRSASLTQRYKSEISSIDQPPHEPGKSVEGESNTSTKTAQPKIFKRSAPNHEDAPQEVQDHNKEIEQRAERRSHNMNDENIEKDKVSKGFWSGEQAAGGAVEPEKK